MPKSGPIIFIEDDLDDQELFSEAIQELQISNKITFFDNGQQALSFLLTTSDKPFIIFCDINMPILNGIELRNEMNNNEYLKNKSIPFIFLTTTADKKVVEEAYYNSVQGFFQKPENFAEIKVIIQKVVDYWTKCKHPNSF